MPASTATPGYVYVLAHPQLVGWHKVGRTYRPPHERAQELSRTAWPSPFEVVHARFFWDSIAAEHATHQKLTQHAARRKEFFAASVALIRQTIEDLPMGLMSLPAPQHVTLPQGEAWDAPWQRRVADADEWATSWDYRENQWAQGELEVAHSNPAIQRQGWRRWMRLSAEGWAQGSWDLAERLIQVHPGPEGGRRAAWVFEAAQSQGMSGGRLRAAWIRSLIAPADHLDWEGALGETWRQLKDQPPEIWPAAVVSTLVMERQMCASRPDWAQSRAQSNSAFGGWEGVPL